MFWDRPFEIYCKPKKLNDSFYLFAFILRQLLLDRQGYPTVGQYTFILLVSLDSLWYIYTHFYCMFECTSWIKLIKQYRINLFDEIGEAVVISLASGWHQWGVWNSFHNAHNQQIRTCTRGNAFSNHEYQSNVIGLLLMRRSLLINGFERNGL